MNKRPAHLFVGGVLALWLCPVAFTLSESANVHAEDKSQTSSPASDQLPKGAMRRIRVHFEKLRAKETGGVNAVAWSPDGKELACRCSDNTARIFAMPEAKEILQTRFCPLQDSGWDPGGGGVLPLVFSPDARLLGIAYPSGISAKIWDTKSGKLIELPTSWGTVDCIAFSPDGSTLYMTGRRGIQLWDVQTGKQLKVLNPTQKGDDETARKTKLFLFTPDGRSLVMAGTDPVIRWVNRETGTEIGNLMPKNIKRVVVLTLSPDGRTVAVSGSTSTGRDNVEVWELASGQLIHLLEGSRNCTPSIAVSPDGIFLAASEASAFPFNKVTVWNLYTGQELAMYQGHTKNVFQIAFSPDGKSLVSAGQDGMLMFWRVPELQTSSKEIEPKKLEQLWEQLAGDNATLAYQAIWGLRQSGDQATTFIAKRVKPVPEIDAEAVKKLVAELDDPVFATRKKAAGELAKLGERAEPALRKALEGEPSPELRKQVDSLLSNLRFPRYSGEPLRSLRAVQVLERVGTPKSREALEELGKGAPGARLTKDAKAAAERLARRKAGK